MARHAPGWHRLQHIQDEARLAAYLQAHPEAVYLTTLPSSSPAPDAAGEDATARQWCPSWDDDDAGYADEWTDEDEAIAVAEANALWEREQAERAQAGRFPVSQPLLRSHTASPLTEAVGVTGRVGHRRPRWWYHAFWWLVIIVLTVGTYRLVS